MSRILIAALFLVAIVLAEHPTALQLGFCAATIRGSTYDLTAASHNSTTDWTYTGYDGMRYYINVCNNLVSTNPCGNDAPGYEFDPNTGDCTRLGLLEAEWWGNSYFDTQGQGDGIVVMYNEGDACTGTARAKVSMLFHCNHTIATTQLTSVVAIGQYCHWVAHFESPLGCQLSA